MGGDLSSRKQKQLKINSSVLSPNFFFFTKLVSFIAPMNYELLNNDNNIIIIINK